MGVSACISYSKKKKTRLDLNINPLHPSTALRVLDGLVKFANTMAEEEVKQEEEE